MNFSALEVDFNVLIFDLGSRKPAHVGIK